MRLWIHHRKCLTNLTSQTYCFKESNASVRSQVEEIVFRVSDDWLTLITIVVHVEAFATENIQWNIFWDDVKYFLTLSQSDTWRHSLDWFLPLSCCAVSYPELWSARILWSSRTPASRKCTLSPGAQSEHLLFQSHHLLMLLRCQESGSLSPPQNYKEIEIYFLE